MLSTRLLHQIEDHAESLATDVVSRIYSNDNLAAYRGLPSIQVHEEIRSVCRNLGEWLTETSDGLQENYEALGRRRYREGVPLDEIVLALQLTKDRILDFAAANGFSHSALELYGREELELRVSHFFDRAIYFVIRAHEQESEVGKQPRK